MNVRANSCFLLELIDNQSHAMVLAWPEGIFGGKISASLCPRASVHTCEHICVLIESLSFWTLQLVQWSTPSSTSLPTKGSKHFIATTNALTHAKANCCLIHSLCFRMIKLMQLCRLRSTADPTRGWEHFITRTNSSALVCYAHKFLV